MIDPKITAIPKGQHFHHTTVHGLHRVKVAVLNVYCAVFLFKYLAVDALQLSAVICNASTNVYSVRDITCIVEA